MSKCSSLTGVIVSVQILGTNIVEQALYKLRFLQTDFIQFEDGPKCSLKLEVI